MFFAELKVRPLASWSAPPYGLLVETGQLEREIDGRPRAAPISTSSRLRRSPCVAPCA